MIDKVNIEVVCRLPWAPEPIVYAVDVDLRECRDSLMPLPRDRELIPSDAQQAMMQRTFRKRLSDLLARQLAIKVAEAIIQACESRDPQFGYSPEENAKWNQR